MSERPLLILFGIRFWRLDEFRIALITAAGGSRNRRLLISWSESDIVLAMSVLDVVSRGPRPTQGPLMFTSTKIQPSKSTPTTCQMAAISGSELVPCSFDCLLSVDSPYTFSYVHIALSYLVVDYGWGGVGIWYCVDMLTLHKLYTDSVSRSIAL